MGKIQDSLGNIYGLRTWIEYGFKHAKNELGWADYRVTDYASIERWWELVFCAYALVSFQCSALQTHQEESEPQPSHEATPVDHFASASLVGHRSWLEKCPEQLAAHSPALYLFLFALALVVGVRHSTVASRFCRTYWNYELVSCSPPDLTEEGYTLLSSPAVAPPSRSLHDCSSSASLCKDRLVAITVLVLQRDFTSVIPPTRRGAVCDGSNRRRSCDVADTRSNPIPQANLASAVAAEPARASAPEPR